MGSTPMSPIKYMPLAQWLEQRTHNSLVTGSSPVWHTILIGEKHV